MQLSAVCVCMLGALKCLSQIHDTGVAAAVAAITDIGQISAFRRFADNPAVAINAASAVRT